MADCHRGPGKDWSFQSADGECDLRLSRIVQLGDSLSQDITLDFTGGCQWK